MADFDVIVTYWPVLYAGAVTTIQLSSLALALGTAMGLLVGLARTSRNPVVSRLARAYVEVFRSVPILLQLFFIYYALPLVARVDVPSYPAAVAALTLYCSAYMAEVVRTGLESVPHGQWEASLSLGLNYAKTVRHVVIPQAVRVAVPPAISVYVLTIKDSSLASVIGFVELTGSGLAIRESTYGRATFGVLLVVSLIYFLLAFSLSLFGQYVHQKVRL